MAKQRRTALVTGSGRNIGRAVALALATDGFNVVVNGSKDRTACEAVATEISVLGVEPLVAMGDVGIASVAKEIAEAAIRRFGAVDVLVNNAAIRPSNGFLDMKEDWSKSYVDYAWWLSLPGIPGIAWLVIVELFLVDGAPHICPYCTSVHIALIACIYLLHLIRKERDAGNWEAPTKLSKAELLAKARKK